MSSGSAAWLIAALAAGAAAAWIRYGVAEEAIPGRAGPAVLFAGAVFLILAGVALPTLRTADPPEPPRIVLLDISASMDLPARQTGPSRLDSAVAVAQALGPDRTIGFGTDPLPTVDLASPDAAIGGADRSGSRLTPALRLARAAGADSAYVVTDGEIEDRDEARREARRLGIVIRELRAAAPGIRTTIRRVTSPARVSAGDTVRLSLEIVTRGGGDETAAPADSIPVRIEESTGVTTEHRIARPSVGRSEIVTIALPTARIAAESEWRRYAIRLAGGGDALPVQPDLVSWVELTTGASGIVLVSIDPDWEPGFLLPVLERSSSGGASAFARVGPGRWVRVGPAPEPVPESTIRGQAARADLLVVQGDPDELPGWVADAVARHPRVLLLARGRGTIPGDGASLGPALDGDWYAVFSPPASALASALTGLEAESLPPFRVLRPVNGEGAWPILLARRDRRGEDLPAAVGLATDRGRRVVMAAEGTWRWAARAGSPRSVYRGLYSAIVGWLLGDVRGDPVQLVTGSGGEGVEIGWAVAPGVTDLVLRVRNPDGTEVWQQTVTSPPASIPGPRLPAGDLEFEATGSLEGVPFTTGRPFAVSAATAEIAGRDVGDPLTGAGPADAEPSRSPGGRAGPPLWPWVLAACLLCAEWIWRRRLGLR